MFLLCCTAFLITYGIFVRIRHTSRMKINYLALVSSLNIFMGVGLYGNQALFPEYFRITTITDYAVLLAVSGAFYLAAHFLLTVVVSYGDKIGWARTAKSAALLVVIIALIGIALTRMSRRASHNAVPVAAGKNNIILIVMDTTRRDHLPFYGYARNTAPQLDGLARESLLFTNAYSPSPWTLPAHASLMTGLYPSAHGADYNVHATSQPAVNRLQQDFTTLAELLSQYGYRTAGVVGATFCHRFFGIAQGFDYYDDDFRTVTHDLHHYAVFQVANQWLSLGNFFSRHGYHGIRTAAELNQMVFSWLGENYGHPFFLFINYFDPHWPYAPPPPYDLLFEGKDERLIIDTHGSDWNLFAKVINNQHSLTDKEKRHLLSQYDGEIAYLDYHIGQLLERLKRLNIYDESMIVITADHGESFGEHSLMDHGRALYEELLRIPLIVKYPRSRKINGTCSSRVSLIDLMPTVLAALEIPAPDQLQGNVLTEVPDDRRVFAEHYRDRLWIEKFGERFDRDLIALYSGDFKYIGASHGQHELYNVSGDPRESHNLVHELPDIAATMHEETEKRLAHFESAKSGKHDLLQADDAIKQKLRALGYM
jgi:arylsulfatase A-like enzyme